MNKSISAGIIIFRKTDRGLKFLLLYHGRNYWNFPKGQIETGERSWQSAVREVREETGLKSHELKFVRNFKAHERFMMGKGPSGIFRVIILYLAETKQSCITLSGKRQEGYGWFTFSEAKKILSKFHSNLKILTTAHEFLRRGSSSKDAPKPITETPKSAP